MARYTDEYRASAVAMLQAQGYPDKPGALMEVANYLHIHYSVISRWYRAVQNPPPRKLAQIKKEQLIKLIKQEIHAALREMDNARQDADYRALATAVGILTDKMQLLEGEPTERHEHTLTTEERTQRVTQLLETARTRRDGQSARATDD